MQSKKRWAAAVAVGLYLYYLLPLTAVIFYELYHLVEIGAIYWVYSGFKFAGYYFSQWEYRLETSIGVALVIVWVPYLFRKKPGIDGDARQLPGAKMENAS